MRLTKVRGKSSITSKATALVVVRPLPEWAHGTFKGYTEEFPIAGNYVGNMAFVARSRPVTITIGSTGKVSVNIGGLTFTMTGLERARDYASETYFVNVEYTGKGSGKNKNKIVKRDRIRFVLDDGMIDRPAANAISGQLSQWRLETNTTLGTVDSYFYAGKKDFRLVNGEYLPISGDSGIVADLAHLLCCGSMDSDAMRVFCLSPGWINKDVFFPDSDNRTLLRMVDSDTYHGLVPDLMVANRIDGVASVIGSVTYNGKKYDMSGTAWLDLIKGGATSSWIGYSRSEKEKYDYLGDAYTDAYYSVVARIMKNGHALEITWHFHKGQAGLVLENVDASFWP